VGALLLGVSNFDYEIALSFAGEQRQQVEEVAELLRQKGVTVFYDKYEEVTLWGKDLFQHLSEVYRKKAKYCIVFASKEYSEKSWTSHELKSAQARAFEMKGEEYILPVRFDSTEIPGILPTAGYLDFRSHGADGIARLALQKLRGNEVEIPPNRSAPKVVSCTVSPRALISCSEANIQINPLVIDSEWGAEIKLSIRAESEEDEAVFARLHSASHTFIIAFRFHVAMAKLSSAVRRTTEGLAVWNLHFTAARHSFQDQYEVGMGKLTVEDLATMRAERILLNLHVYEDEQEGSSLDLMNRTMVEVGIRGMNSTLPVEGSKFPLLWPVLKENPQEFLNIAWIFAISELKLSSTVEHINKLVLNLNANTLSVQFSGLRHRKYSNVNPSTIEVSGNIVLDSLEKG
jgi:TIR domain